MNVCRMTNTLVRKSTVRSEDALQASWLLEEDLGQTLGCPEISRLTYTCMRMGVLVFAPPRICITCLEPDSCDMIEDVKLVDGEGC
jgi:hypothetical protein